MEKALQRLGEADIILHQRHSNMWGIAIEGFPQQPTLSVYEDA